MKIVLSALVAVFLLGCSEQSESSSKEEVAQKTESAVAKSKEALMQTKEAVEASSDAIKDTVTQVGKSTLKATQEIAQIVEDKSADALKDVTKRAKEAQTDIAKVVKPKPEVVKPTTVAVSGETLYKKCATCHGVNAEKKALNKSQVIRGWESSQIIAAINGYKDGSYGSSMKGVMKPQVAKLSEAEIEAVAKYISGL